MTLAPSDLAFALRDIHERRHEQRERLTKPIFGNGHALEMQRIKVALGRAIEAVVQADKAFTDQDMLVLDGALLNLRTETQTALALASAYQKDIQAHRAREPRVRP
jgi:hypothetical protein